MTTMICVGTIMPFAGDCTNQSVRTALATLGWLPCWGQMVLITDYPDLEGAISNVFGGDDETNIGIPDLRGQFVRGFDGTLAVGATLASATALPESGGFTLDSAGAHTHSVPNVPGWSNDASRCSGHSTYNWNSGSLSSEASSPQTHTHTIVSGGDSETRPINLYLDYIIKAKYSDPATGAA